MLDPKDTQILVTCGYLTSDSTLLHIREWGSLLALCVLILNIITFYEEYFYYITNWGVSIACFYLIYVAIITRVSASSLGRPDGGLSIKYWKFAIFIFEVTWTIEVVVSPGYWIAIYALNVEKTFYRAIIAHLVHSVPFAILLIEIRHNRIRFYKSDLMAIEVLFCTYLMANWYFSFSRNYLDSIYPSVTWDNMTTFECVLIAHILLLIAFYIGYQYGEYKNNKLKDKIENENISLGIIKYAEEILISEEETVNCCQKA